LKKLTFSLALIVTIYSNSNAQQIPVSVLKKVLDTTKNAAGFLTYVAKKKYVVDTAVVYNLNNYRTNEEKIVATGAEGKTYGPFKAGKKNYITKLLFRDKSTYYKLQHILLPKNVFIGAFAKQLADSIIQKINTGTETFESMVSTYSGDDFTKKKNGTIGWVLKGASLPEINAELTKRKPGELFVITTDQGVHIFKIAEKPKQAYSFGLLLKVFL
jgi:parvulin-like peptidyl-prolyl isomerase